jgi:hypothetical protein
MKKHINIFPQEEPDFSSALELDPVRRMVQVQLPPPRVYEIGTVAFYYMSLPN